MTVISRRAFLASAAAGAAAAAVRGAMGAAGARTARRDLANIASVAIHPAVGIARVGNSPDAFFFGPEVPGAVPHGPFKDAAGAMAKQAARFRVFGYDADGRVVAELTAADADITWTVVAGNAKAAWYGADEPLDLPEATPMPLRNAGVADRSSLAVVSRAVRVRGAASRPVALSGGTFLGTPVGLGEVLTDASGRLIVLPGSGRAVQADGAPALAGFADNDGWTDTTADGPVFARVRIGERTFEAAPARVICGSPNYGPGIASGLTTLYDTVFAGLVLAGRRKRPRTDFLRDVEPIFERMTDMQWVNAGYLTSNGFGSLRDWSSSEWRARLSDRSRENTRLRRSILQMFRDPFYGTVQPAHEPQEYGDMVTVPSNREQPRQWFALSPVQHAHLRAWAEGDFTLEARADGSTIEDFPVQQRPDVLDRAALDACLGGAFHPGVEFPWLARVDWLWTDDLRLRSAARRPNLGPFGETLTPAVAMSRQGPLRSLGPGDIVKWMGVPWQADSASCRFGYQETVSLTLPAFWPARIPNSVLTAADYQIVMDSDRAMDERTGAFQRREQWERYIAFPKRVDILSAMVQDWPRLGIVRELPGPADGAFPARMKVEARVEFAGPAPDTLAGVEHEQMSRFPLVVVDPDAGELLWIDDTGLVTRPFPSVSLSDPRGIACDAMGHLFVADRGAGTVARIAPDGASTTMASGLTAPTGITCDGWGNVYVGGEGWVIHLAQDGAVSDLITAPRSRLSVAALAIAPDGALLVSDDAGGRVLRYDPLLRTMLDPAWLVGLAGPRSMAWDARGSLYLVEERAGSLRRFDPRGRELPVMLSGLPLDDPFGIAFNGYETLFVTCAGGQDPGVVVVNLTDDRAVVSAGVTGVGRPAGMVLQGNIAPVPLT